MITVSAQEMVKADLHQKIETTFGNDIDMHRLLEAITGLVDELGLEGAIHWFSADLAATQQDDQGFVQTAINIIRTYHRMVKEHGGACA